MIPYLLEKMSRHKEKCLSYFNINLDRYRDSTGISFLCPEKTALLHRHALLGQMTQGFFHDLLSPLSALQLYMNYTTQETSGSVPNPYTEIAHDIQKELSEFIHTIKYQLQNPDEIQEVSFHTLCQTACTLLKHKLLKNDIQVQILGPHELILKAQSIFVIQVLTNLISNSIDAYKDFDFPDRKIISISFIQKDQRLFVEVKDTGKGISQELQKNIFHLYTTTKETGHGIGLATVKHVVTEILKGSIMIESTEGISTTVRFDLPMDHQSPEHSLRPDSNQGRNNL